MRKVALIAVLVLVGVPGAALAAKPSHPATPANSHANSNANATSTTGTSSKASSNAQSVTMLFVIRGTLGAYTAASGSTNGSIAITVTSSNHESTLLKNATQPLTFVVSSKTNVVGTVTSGHDGIVKVRAAKNASVATLQTLTAVQLIDQGTAA
jgi:hypothetical protein